MYFENKITDVKDLPLTLNVSDISRILGISKANAYELCHSDGFPAVKVSKRRIIIPKIAFVNWLENPTSI